jgi:hypothetical protein
MTLEHPHLQRGGITPRHRHEDQKRHSTRFSGVKKPLYVKAQTAALRPRHAFGGALQTGAVP